MNITLKSIAGFYSSKDGDINSRAKKKKKKSIYITHNYPPPQKKKKCPKVLYCILLVGSKHVWHFQHIANQTSKSALRSVFMNWKV